MSRSSGGTCAPTSRCRSARRATSAPPTSTADALVILDVDCIAASDLVDRYDAVLRRHPAAMACGAVRYLRRGWQRRRRCVRHLGPRRTQCCTGRPAAAAARRDAGSMTCHHELFWSLSFGVGRPLWDRLGGFDERFVGYGAEDTDLGLAGAPPGRAPGLVLWRHRLPPVAPAGATRSRPGPRAGGQRPPVPRPVAALADARMADRAGRARLVALRTHAMPETM